MADFQLYENNFHEGSNDFYNSDELLKFDMNVETRRKIEEVWKKGCLNYNDRNAETVSDSPIRQLAFEMLPKAKMTGKYLIGANIDKVGFTAPVKYDDSFRGVNYRIKDVFGNYIFNTDHDTFKQDFYSSYFWKRKVNGIKTSVKSKFFSKNEGITDIVFRNEVVHVNAEYFVNKKIFTDNTFRHMRDMTQTELDYFNNKGYLRNEIYDNSYDGTYTQSNPRDRLTETYFDNYDRTVESGIYIEWEIPCDIITNVTHDIIKTVNLKFYISYFLITYSEYSIYLNNINIRNPLITPIYALFNEENIGDYPPIYMSNDDNNFSICNLFYLNDISELYSTNMTKFMFGKNSYNANEIQSVNSSDWNTSESYIPEPYDPSQEENNPINPDTQDKDPTTITPIGGNGTGDNTSDVIDLGVSATGTSELCNSYALTFTELEELQKAFIEGSLWTNISTFFKEPTDGVINVLAFPFDVYNFDATHCTFKDPIALMGVNMEWIGGKVTGYKLEHEMKTRIQMGYIDFQEFYGCFIDYDYTKINLYLPHLGFTELDAKTVMGKRLEVFYNVSYIDGSCMAVLTIDDKPFKIVNGNIGYQLPLSKTDKSDIIQNGIKSVIGAVGATTAMIATGGMAGAVVGAGVLSTTASIGSEVVSNGSALNSVGSFMEKSNGTISGKAESVHARAMSPIPFVIIERPYTNIPSNYGDFTGYQTNTYAQLGSLNGMTVCDNIKLNNFSTATETEKDEIKKLLSSGVIL